MWYFKAVSGNSAHWRPLMTERHDWLYKSDDRVDLIAESIITGALSTWLGSHLFFPTYFWFMSHNIESLILLSLHQKHDSYILLHKWTAILRYGLINHTDQVWRSSPHPVADASPGRVLFGFTTKPLQGRPTRTFTARQHKTGRSSS